jgi:hypothetical protein
VAFINVLKKKRGKLKFKRDFTGTCFFYQTNPGPWGILPKTMLPPIREAIVQSIKEPR